MVRIRAPDLIQLGKCSGKVAPDRITTTSAVKNAVAVAMATGCSTNAIIYLIATAQQDLTIDQGDQIAAGRDCCRLPPFHDSALGIPRDRDQRALAPQVLTGKAGVISPSMKGPNCGGLCGLLTVTDDA